MPTNVSPEFFKVQRKYLEARTLEDKREALEEMIRVCPKHKGSENLLAQLKSRLSKLKKQIEQEKKKKKGGSKEGIRKTGDAQVSVVGMTNTGKSSLLSCITNAKPKIASYQFTTTKPEIGTMNHEGYEIQIVEIPAITGKLENDRHNLSISRDSDLLIILATTKEELEKTLKELDEARIKNKKVIVMNKFDLKIPLAINIPYISISCKNAYNLEELRKKIIQELGLMRVYSKDPAKKPSNRPIVLKRGATIRDICGKIRRDFIDRFLFAKIWGKSVKFPGQQTGLEHRVEDKDIVEIHLKN